MAKKKRNKSAKVHSRSFDDNESTLDDGESVCSTTTSSGGSNSSLDETTFEGRMDDGFLVEDDFEDKLGELLDALQNNKAAAKTRLTQFVALSKAMASRFCAEYFSERKLTMQDILERALKRSSDEAASAALSLGYLLITMASDDDFCENIFSALYEQLLRIFVDNTAKASARSSCALALGLGTFITHFGSDKLSQILQHFLAISFAPIRGCADSSQLYTLKATSLSMFSFLISLESSHQMEGFLLSNMRQLIVCLESPNLPLRIAAGQCIALLLEQFPLVIDEDEDFELEQICSLLQALATDSQKSRSKKELREQRSIFRQIFATVNGDQFTEQVVTIAGNQQLAIDCWQWKRYYDTFCSVLGSGMRLHLSQNPFLREVFDLGPVPVLITDDKAKKISKMEKNMQNSFNQKTRKMGRQKTRSKKADLQRWED